MILPRTRSLRRRILATALAFLAAAATADEFTATPSGAPTPFLEPVEGSTGAFQVDRTIEASALATAGDGRYLVVAHDKQAPLRLVETATARRVGTLSSPRFPGETPNSTKWEAMAEDADGAFYVVGSHSGKTEDERIQHRKLIRFRLAPASGPGGLPAIDDASVVSWGLDAGLERALRGLGLPDEAVGRRKVEGLAIRETATAPTRRELVIGLREPDDLVRTFVVDVTARPADGAELAPTPFFAFAPGAIEGVRSQLTSLEYVPAWKGFAIVTATEDDRNGFHGNTLWFAADDRIARAGGTPIEPEKAWAFEPTMKAEGLCILPGAASSGPGSVRFAIAFDNDARVTGAPGRLWIIDLARRAKAE
ncbi:hypothetical protein [Paludisphaera mucosa]|uniref:Phytase-like domain-containing protein n=1 Tax=Paludisphaera mucosa TaxID=3030827 RepID=A0ABT6FJW1_9BACT|nr:hypothetical protein [Paludisphaera mucosa]MDG3007832.1 hypothetical protein [Paludisphaera mucosa]